MKVALLILALVALSIGSLNEAQSLEKFEEWITKFNKVYSSEEVKNQHFVNFKESLARVEKLQQKSNSDKLSTATFGLTKYSDMSTEQFANTILMRKRSSISYSEELKGHLEAQQLPSAFDWRQKGAVTPVKDQGQCGSCWAFSATETVESSWILSHSLNGTSMPPLSPQQIVDCSDLDFGCDGGNPPTAYHYIYDAGGLDTNAQYPYTAEDGTCSVKKPTYATITDWHFATLDLDEQEMQQALVQKQPLSACVDASSWQDYTGGVLTASQCSIELDHCIQVVGYDLSSSTPYWIIRNSWGTDWGENGFIRLQYGQNTCGVAIEVTYVDT